MSSNTFFNNVLKDIQTELVDEFDLNFERKAFFDRPWAPLSKNYQPTGGSMLLRTGALRRSIRSRISGTSLIYSSSLRYAGLMNYGGTVRQDFVPTPKMRRWAWANFHALQQSGKTSEAEKYRRMALAKRPADFYCSCPSFRRRSSKGAGDSPRHRIGTCRSCHRGGDQTIP